jgi:hypothetical protein
MAPVERAETCSWNILLKVHFNKLSNRKLLDYILRVYTLYFHIYTMEHNGDFSPELVLFLYIFSREF